MNSEQKFYTIKEVSEIVGISEAEIINLIIKRKLKAVRIDKAIRIKETDLNNFLDF